MANYCVTSFTGEGLGQELEYNVWSDVKVAARVNTVSVHHHTSSLLCGKI